MLIRVLKNLPVFLWCVGFMYLTVRHLSVLMTIALAVMAGGPIVFLALRKKKEEKLTKLPRRLSALSTLSVMTILGVTKSALSCGMAQRHGDVADRS